MFQFRIYILLTDTGEDSKIGHRRICSKKETAQIIAKFPLERHRLSTVSFFEHIRLYGLIEKRFCRTDLWVTNVYSIDCNNDIAFLDTS